MPHGRSIDRIKPLDQARQSQKERARSIKNMFTMIGIISGKLDFITLAKYR